MLRALIASVLLVAAVVAIAPTGSAAVCARSGSTTVTCEYGGARCAATVHTDGGPPNPSWGCQGLIECVRECSPPLPEP